MLLSVVRNGVTSMQSPRFKLSTTNFLVVKKIENRVFFLDLVKWGSKLFCSASLTKGLTRPSCPFFHTAGSCFNKLKTLRVLAFIHSNSCLICAYHFGDCICILCVLLLLESVSLCCCQIIRAVGNMEKKELSEHEVFFPKKLHKCDLSFSGEF